MGVLDAINLKMGKGSLKLASEGIVQGWKMKMANKSPAYLSDWKELPVSAAGSKSEMLQFAEQKWI